jgi:hypothetical protein
MIDRKFIDAQLIQLNVTGAHHLQLHDNDIHRFYELLDKIDRPINTYDYELPVKQQEPAAVKPTQSVVEVHQHQISTLCTRSFYIN